MKNHLRFLWLAAVAVMGGMAIPCWVKPAGGRAPRQASHDASIEATFAAITGEAQVPERLKAELARLPLRRPVLVLQDPGNIKSVLPGNLIAYVAYPRPVVAREIKVQNTTAAVRQLAEHFAAVIFVAQEPPSAFGQGQFFGREIVYYPLSGRES